MVLYVSGKWEEEILESALAYFACHAETGVEEILALKLLSRVLECKRLQGKKKAATPKDSD